MSLYADTYSEYTTEKKPTLKQYLTSRKGKNLRKRYLVVKVWIPNKYPTYGIETEDFRTTVGKTSPLGELLQEHWEALVRSESATYLQFQKEGEKISGLRFVEGKDPGFWETIGKEELMGITWKMS